MQKHLVYSPFYRKAGVTPAELEQQPVQWWDVDQSHTHAPACSNESGVQQLSTGRLEIDRIRESILATLRRGLDDDESLSPTWEDVRARSSEAYARLSESCGPALPHSSSRLSDEAEDVPVPHRRRSDLAATGKRDETTATPTEPISLATAKPTVASLQAQLHNVNKAKDALSHENKQLEERLCSMEKRNISLEKELKTTKSQIRDRMDSVQRIRRQADSDHKIVERLTMQLEEKEKRIKILEDQHKSRERFMAATQKKYKQMRNAYFNAVKDGEKAQEQLAELGSENKTLKDRLRDLRRRLIKVGEGRDVAGMSKYEPADGGRRPLQTCKDLVEVPPRVIASSGTINIQDTLNSTMDNDSCYCPSARERPERRSTTSSTTVATRALELFHNSQKRHQ
eukprot:GHVU01154512.1.p1 GENE.GHVU01154512.1~~GHVU01154512.1.p1  ORF type:complete len:398 (-),score=49.27 GHVU01154512.1:771-1964(-)